MPINSQAKGKRAERDLANWWKDNGYPGAARAVKTGTTQTHDAGDLILEWNDFRLCVEVKHHAGGLTPLDVQRFGDKLMDQVRESKSHLGILVERRDRVAYAGLWWAHLDAYDFALLRVPRLEDFGFAFSQNPQWQPVRVTVGYLARLLSDAGLAQPRVHLATCAESGSRRSGTEAEKPQAVGGS